MLMELKSSSIIMHRYFLSECFIYIIRLKCYKCLDHNILEFKCCPFTGKLRFFWGMNKLFIRKSSQLDDLEIISCNCKEHLPLTFYRPQCWFDSARKPDYQLYGPNYPWGRKNSGLPRALEPSLDNGCSVPTSIGLSCQTNLFI